MTYFNHWLDGKNLEKDIRKATKILKDYDFDSIICRGNSGLLFASPLAMRLKKNLLISRKKDNSHSDVLVEGNLTNVKKLLIIDDFICTGSTVKEIYKSLNHCKKKFNIVGIYLYARLTKKSNFALEKTYIHLNGKDIGIKLLNYEG